MLGMRSANSGSIRPFSSVVVKLPPTIERLAQEVPRELDITGVMLCPRKEPEQRRRAGIAFWSSSAILRQGPATFLLMVPVALASAGPGGQ